MKDTAACGAKGAGQQECWINSRIAGSRNLNEGGVVVCRSCGAANTLRVHYSVLHQLEQSADIVESCAES